MPTCLVCPQAAPVGTTACKKLVGNGQPAAVGQAETKYIFVPLAKTIWGAYLHCRQLVDVGILSSRVWART